MRQWMNPAMGQKSDIEMNILKLRINSKRNHHLASGGRRWTSKWILSVPSLRKVLLQVLIKVTTNQSYAQQTACTERRWLSISSTSTSSTAPADLYDLETNIFSPHPGR